jgi:hypothetical protein
MPSMTTMTRRRWLMGSLLPLLAGLAVLAYADDFSMLFVGSKDDFRFLEPQDKQPHEFTFVRLMYNGRIPAYLKNWYTDYPTGDQKLVSMLKRLTSIDVAPDPRAIPIHHPDLFDYPMIYSAEAGQMVFDESDARTLREYLGRGGFWMIDDFWGTDEWANFQQQIALVLPGQKIVDIPADHEIFHTMFNIDTKLQVPNIGYAYCSGVCHTWELDGYDPFVRGIFDENGRLLVLINFNTDLMDASEWADDASYPHRFSAYAYKVFSNAVVYAMSH